MPLYQKQGNDGFFVVKRINPFWLGTSYHLRKLGADSLLSSLPGIERKSNLSETLIVDEKIAKLMALISKDLLNSDTIMAFTEQKEKLETIEKEIKVEIKKVRKKKNIAAAKLAKQKANYVFKGDERSITIRFQNESPG